jgi:hypothetical protein
LTLFRPCATTIAHGKPKPTKARTGKSRNRQSRRLLLIFLDSFVPFGKPRATHSLFGAPSELWSVEGRADMQHRSHPEPWYFVPVKPGSDASFRRWNVVIISMLAALVLGLLLTAALPQPPGSTVHKAPTKIHNV